MLAFLRRWWSRDRRAIFRFWDGAEWQRADPLKVMSVIEDDCPEWGALLDAVEKGIETVPPGPMKTDLLAVRRGATEKLLAVTRRAFGVAELDGKTGLTRAETLGLLARFLVWMVGLAEDARPLPDWPAAESHSPPASTTEPSAASTSIGTGS